MSVILLICSPDFPPSRIAQLYPALFSLHSGKLLSRVACKVGFPSFKEAGGVPDSEAPTWHGCGQSSSLRNTCRHSQVFLPFVYSVTHSDLLHLLISILPVSYSSPKAKIRFPLFQGDDACSTWKPFLSSRAVVFTEVGSRNIAVSVGAPESRVDSAVVLFAFRAWPWVVHGG